MKMQVGREVSKEKEGTNNGAGRSHDIRLHRHVCLSYRTATLAEVSAAKDQTLHSIKLQNRHHGRALGATPTYIVGYSDGKK